MDALPPLYKFTIGLLGIFLAIAGAVARFASIRKAWLKGNSLTRWGLGLGVPAAFFVAAFLLWQSEYAEVLRLTGELAKLRSQGVSGIAASPAPAESAKPAAVDDGARNSSTVVSPDTSLTVVPEEIAISGTGDRKYSRTLIIRSSKELAKVGLVFTCNEVISDADFYVEGVVVYEDALRGQVKANPKLYYVGYDKPPLGANTPLFVTLSSSKPFTVLRVDQVNLGGG